MKLYTVKELQGIINEQMRIRLEMLKNSSPKGLYHPVIYSVEMGGKRLRPVLLLLAYNMFSDKVSEAVPAALAIEVFHNFTLLHDDIMDKAEVRRNLPTVHKKFSENSAILSGDVMSFLSYRFLLECKTEKISGILDLFTQTAIEVCEGQQLDMEFENRLDVKEEEYLEMIRLKTAVLLACGLQSGAMLAGAPALISNQLYDYGINLGMAFQLQDDLLDSFGNQESFGKKIGGDILANKKTYLSIKAIENATGDKKRELINWFNNNNCNPMEKIKSVTDLYNQLNIKEQTEQKIDFYFQNCKSVFSQIELPEDKKSVLKELTNSMLIRKS